MGIVSDRVDQFSKSSAVNNELTWGDVGAMQVSGRPVRQAFLDAKMVCLPARTKLYKFHSYPGLQPDTQGHITGWWSPYDAFDVDPGWDAKRMMAKHLKVNIRELGRVTSAITESWNTAEYLAVMTLKVHIWVAYGRFKHQARGPAQADNSRRITLITADRSERSPGVGEAQGPRQIRDEGRLGTKNLPGGGRQFFIPNLKPQHYSHFYSRSLLSA